MLEFRKHSLFFSVPLELILTFSVLVGIPNYFANAGQYNPRSKSLISIKKNEIDDERKFAATGQLSRSRNIVDYKDGSRSDNVEIQFVPSYRTPYGGLSLRLGFAQDLNNFENSANGISDVVVGFALPSMVWNHTSTSTNLGFSLSGVLPTSNLSKKQSQLRGAMSAAMAFGLKTKPASFGEFTFSTSVSAGQSFHAFEEDTNGLILAQYSSNQNFTLGYSKSEFSLNFEFWNRSRWSYQNFVRQSFIMTQEAGYEINRSFSIAAGHTNEGSVLKANGQDSNIDFYNNDTSTIYFSLGVVY